MKPRPDQASGAVDRADESEGGEVAHVLVDEGLIQMRHVTPLRVLGSPVAQLPCIIPVPTETYSAHCISLSSLYISIDGLLSCSILEHKQHFEGSCNNESSRM